MASLRVKFGADTADFEAAASRVKRVARETQTTISGVEAEHRKLKRTQEAELTRFYALQDRERARHLAAVEREKVAAEKKANKERESEARRLTAFYAQQDAARAAHYAKAEKDKTNAEKAEAAKRTAFSIQQVRDALAAREHAESRAQDRFKDKAAQVASDVARTKAKWEKFSSDKAAESLALSRRGTEEVHQYYRSKQLEKARIADGLQKAQDLREEQSANRKKALGSFFGSAGRIALGVGAAALVGGSYAVRTLRDVAHGFGAETDYTEHMRANVALEAGAARLSNQAFIEGKGSAGTRVAPEAVERTARDVANFAAMKPQEVIEALTKFVDKTGDLETGREILGNMAKLSKATGANLIDMVDAAADVALNLGDVEDKGTVVERVMNKVAAMGKTGAVEIKDLAFYMSKVAANSAIFEGSMEKNIVEMAALAELARARGGAASAAEAATGIQSFANQFGKNPRIKGFQALGIDVKSKSEPGKFRDPFDILRELIAVTGGDPSKMNAAIGDARAQRVTRAYGALYQEGAIATRKGLQGTGLSGAEIEDAARAAGLRKLDDAIESLKQSMLSDKAIADSFAVQMGTTEAKAQLFNNKLGEAVKGIQVGLLGPLEQLAPMIVGLAEKIGDFVGGNSRTLESDIRGMSGDASSVKAMFETDANGDIKRGQNGEPIVRQKVVEPGRMWSRPEQDYFLAQTSAQLKSDHPDWSPKQIHDRALEMANDQELALKQPVTVNADNVPKTASATGKLSTVLKADLDRAEAAYKKQAAKVAAEEDYLRKSIFIRPNSKGNFEVNPITAGSGSLISDFSQQYVDEHINDQRDLATLEKTRSDLKDSLGAIAKLNTILTSVTDGNALRVTSKDEKPPTVAPAPQTNGDATTPPEDFVGPL